MTSACGSACLNSFVSPVVTGADVARCLELGHFGLAKELLAYGQASLDFSKRCVSVTSASIRSASSASSLSSGGGLTGARLAAISKVGSWRSGTTQFGVSGVAADGVVNRVPDGYCYTKLLNKSSVEGVVSKLGKWPTLGSLLCLGYKDFQSVEQLERFRLVNTSGQKWHVLAGGSQGVSFLDAATKCSTQKMRLGTFGAHVLSREKLSNVPVISGSHRLGGKSGCEVKGGDGSGSSSAGSPVLVDVSSPFLPSSGFSVGVPVLSASVAMPFGHTSDVVSEAMRDQLPSPLASSGFGFRFVFGGHSEAVSFAAVVQPVVELVEVKDGYSGSSVGAYTAVEVTFTSKDAAVRCKSSAVFVSAMACYLGSQRGILEEYVLGEFIKEEDLNDYVSDISYVFSDVSQARKFRETSAFNVSSMLRPKEASVYISGQHVVLTYPKLTFADADFVMDRSSKDTSLIGTGVIVAKQMVDPVSLVKFTYKWKMC